MIIGMRDHLTQADQDLVARRVGETRKAIKAAKESDRLRSAAIRRRGREIVERREAAFRERQLEMEFSSPQDAPGAPKPPPLVEDPPTTPQAARADALGGS